MPRKSIVFLVLLFCINVTVDAQQKGDALLQMAMEHFGNAADKHVWWLKDMNGYLDHTHEVRMVLATDNVSFKGAYEILSSKQRFYLDGEHDGEQIVLIETDSLDRPTGYIKGDMNDDRFYCEWTDRNVKNPLPLFLYHNSPSPNPCGNVGWVHYYKVDSRIVDSLQSIVIMKNGADAALMLNTDKHTITHSLECDNDACDRMRHIPSNFTDLDEITIDIDQHKMVFKSSLGQNTIDIIPIKSVYLNCATYFDFDEQYSFLYPIAGDKKFNQYIQSEFVEKYMSTTHHEYQLQNQCSLSDRISHVEYGNIKIDWFNDTLISGVFIFQSSKIHQVTEIPFHYNFVKKKPIVIGDFFESNFSFASLKEKLIAEEKKKRKDAGDEYFQKAAYDIISLGRSGFICRTPFNTIYGSDQIILPYSAFRSFFKKNSGIKF